MLRTMHQDEDCYGRSRQRKIPGFSCAKDARIEMLAGGPHVFRSEQFFPDAWFRDLEVPPPRLKCTSYRALTLPGPAVSDSFEGVPILCLLVEYQTFLCCRSGMN